MGPFHIARNTGITGTPSKGLPVNYRLFVSTDRCTLVRFWDNGTVEVCTREVEAGIWGPPTLLLEEESA